MLTHAPLDAPSRAAGLAIPRDTRSAARAAGRLTCSSSPSSSANTAPRTVNRVPSSRTSSSGSPSSASLTAVKARSDSLDMLPTLQPELPRDQHELHLGGALADLEDLRVAVVPRDD